MTKRIVLAILFIGMAVWLKFLFTPLVTSEGGVRYVLQPGASVKTFIHDLTEQNIIKHPLFFSLLLKLRGDANQWKAGEYIFKKGTTPSQMMNQMAEGRGIIYRSFTIIPGWSFKQLRDAMTENRYFKHTITDLSDKDIMQRVDISVTNPEAQFFPDTYFFMEGSPDIVVLKRAHALMIDRFNQAWNVRDANLFFKNPYEVLIAASLVEKEAYLKEERSVIAGVLINRMKKHMYLQFDPTVIYSLGSAYTGKLHKQDLRIRSPFNTYVYKGLPPAPIAIPSLDSISAVLHPSNHDYFYFVAKHDGSHQFSKTLSEHNKAVTEVNRTAALRSFFNRDRLGFYLQGIPV